MEAWSVHDLYGHPERVAEFLPSFDKRTVSAMDRTEFFQRLEVRLLINERAKRTHTSSRSHKRENWKHDRKPRHGSRSRPKLSVSFNKEGRTVLTREHSNGKKEQEVLREPLLVLSSLEDDAEQERDHDPIDYEEEWNPTASAPQLSTAEVAEVESAMCPPSSSGTVHRTMFPLYPPKPRTPIASSEYTEEESQTTSISYVTDSPDEQLRKRELEALQKPNALAILEPPVRDVQRRDAETSPFHLDASDHPPKPRRSSSHKKKRSSAVVVRPVPTRPGHLDQGITQLIQKLLTAIMESPVLTSALNQLQVNMGPRTLQLPPQQGAGSAFRSVKRHESSGSSRAGNQDRRRTSTPSGDETVQPSPQFPLEETKQQEHAPVSQDRRADEEDHDRHRDRHHGHGHRRHSHEHRRRSSEDRRRRREARHDRDGRADRDLNASRQERDRDARHDRDGRADRDLNASRQERDHEARAQRRHRSRSSRSQERSGKPPERKR